MNSTKYYKLPKLKYGFLDLAPVISGEQLRIHYEKHHRNYVETANLILEMLDQTKDKSQNSLYPSVARALSFNINGHILHSLFWENITPKVDGGEISKELKKLLEENFGSVEKFKEAFILTAKSVEGSGWAVLSYCQETNRLFIEQIEKHNLSSIIFFPKLLVLDVWEHAYYLDYKNEREKYSRAFWEIVNWKEVSRRLKEGKNEQ